MNQTEKQMKRLPTKFTKHRYQFEQLCRTESTAIYVQHINGRQKSFEVIIIRIANRKPVKSGAKVTWVKCEPYECYPSRVTAIEATEGRGCRSVSPNSIGRTATATSNTWNWSP